MGTNLKVTHYNDGTEITNITNASQWADDTNGAYRWYNDNIEQKAENGALYNAFAVRTGKLAPKGWHVATDEDFNKLEMTLGMSYNDIHNTGSRGSDQGAKLKAIQKWPDNELKTNEYGFSAFPSGLIQLTGQDFTYLGKYAFYWSLNNTGKYTYRRIDYNSNTLYRDNTDNSFGLSVRCVRNTN